MIPAVLLGLVGAGGLAQLARISVSWRYRPLYDEEGARAGVDPNLLHAIAIHESRENPNAIGVPNKDGSRDYGLMQINERNFATLGLTASSWREPRANVRAAAHLLELNRSRAPTLGLLDEISVYNAGFSRHGPRARVTEGGFYVNVEYVLDVLGRYAQVTAATFAPLKRVPGAA